MMMVSRVLLLPASISSLLFIIIILLLCGTTKGADTLVWSYNRNVIGTCASSFSHSRSSSGQG